MEAIPPKTHSPRCARADEVGARRRGHRISVRFAVMGMAPPGTEQTYRPNSRASAFAGTVDIAELGLRIR